MSNNNKFEVGVAVLGVGEPSQDGSWWRGNEGKVSYVADEPYEISGDIGSIVVCWDDGGFSLMNPDDLLVL